MRHSTSGSVYKKKSFRKVMIMIKKPNILVVGSFVMDLIVSTEKFPGSGETVLGKSYRTAPGGKGANQAVQAARCGANVTMVGKVGADVFGNDLINSAEASGIDVSHVVRDQNNPSAVGNIILEVKEGEKSKNRIIVVPGANMAITEDDVAFLKEEIKQYDMVILQLEIPMHINELIAGWAHESGVAVMLNSAPSAPLSDGLLSCLAYISPNEHEAADLTGIDLNLGSGIDKEAVKSAAKVLMDKGVQNVIITLGSNGAFLGNREEEIFVPCVDVLDVVDPTAAGDSFVGSFTTGICAGMTHRQALDFASFAATITVSRMGAQPSLPTISEIAMLMEKEGYSGLSKEELNQLK